MIGLCIDEDRVSGMKGREGGMYVAENWWRNKEIHTTRLDVVVVTYTTT